MKSNENIHKSHRSRLRKKYVENGIDSFPPHEVLELLLFYSYRQVDTNEIAHRLLKKDLLKGKKCFLVLRSKKEAKIVYRYLKSAYENLDIVGVYSMDTGVTEEALVNEINTKVPDLILMAMENHEAESFLKHKRHMINAKMGVVLSGVMDMILRENIHVPDVIKKLHLGKIYTSAARIPYSVRWRRRIFRKKMDNYNTKKQLEQSDAQKELSEDEKHDQ